MHVGQAVHDQRSAQQRCPSERWRAAEIEERGGDQRQPSAPCHLQMRQMIEAKLHEAIQNAGHCRRERRSGRQARQHECAIRGKRESEKHGHVVDGQRRHMHQGKRQDDERDAEKILAVRQRISGRIKHRSLINGQRMPDQSEAVPVQDPGVDVGIAGIDDVAVDLEDERPRHGDRKRGADERRI